MDCGRTLPKSLDPVSTEITLIRLLDELQSRRSSVSANRSCVEELTAQAAKLHERLYVEKQRAKDAEERAAGEGVGIKLSRETHLRPLLLRKTDLGSRRAKLKQRLAALEDRVRELENQQMKLQSKARDLRDQAERLSNLESTQASLIRDLQESGRATLSDVFRATKRQHKVETEAVETLQKHTALVRESETRVARIQYLLSENSLLKESLRTAQTQLNCLEARDDRHQDSEPQISFCKGVVETLQEDLASCRCDFKELQSALKLTDVSDTEIQTTTIQGF
ncbi:hypothetical protein HPB47_006860 [Ixodes persulcatus]|uniref:Uncharacterized protein n=1 Tax=Ixodes persulcatus TaxID=34615 RepID=A0AC60P970_IXOPE|nr:hypothetical protein HPB47_006860 [Ixodes persulcatus]